MGTGMGQRTYAALLLVLAVVLFFAVNILATTMLRQAHLDLTETGLFTLSDGTRQTLKSLKDPIKLRFFYSEEAALKYPAVRTYAQRVRDMLETFVDESNGKISLEVIKPKPFSPDEDQAADAGLAAAPTAGSGSLYFGLEGSNLANGHEVIPYFMPERETLLEYDLTLLVERLTELKKPVLGIVSGLPLAGTPQGRPYRLYQEISDSYSVLSLQNDITRVPDGVKVVVIIHPQRLTQSALYAIDQFVLKGGRALVFVDPLSELANDAAQGRAPDEAVTSSLEPLLGAWGVSMQPDAVVGDRSLAQRVIATSSGQDRVVNYIAWLGLNKSEMNPDDPVTAEISAMNVGTIGHFEKLKTGTTNVTPLVRSTTDAELLPTAAVRYMPDPEALYAQFHATGERYILAARVTGPAKTAFPQGAPAAAPVTPPEGEAPKPAEPPLPAQVTESKGVNVILVADTDLFNDQFWVEVKNVMGEDVAVPTANNGDFVLNAIENLTGSTGLMSLRGRRVAVRKFTVVDDLRKSAEQRYLTEQTALQTKLKATEQRLAQLRRHGGAGEEAGAVIVSAAQRAEIESLRKEFGDTRLKLREVERSLRSDIDRLGAWLRFFNIGAIPLLVACGALVVVFIRRRRRAQRASALSSSRGTPG